MRNVESLNATKEKTKQLTLHTNKLIMLSKSLSCFCRDICFNEGENSEYIASGIR